MTEQKRWVVTLSGERPIAEMRRALAAAGFEVEQALDAIGIVTGRCAEPTAKTVRTIEGVADVSPDGEVGIGPPGGSDYC